VRTDNLKKALQPYEAKLQAQERFRKLIGVKEVNGGPTYEKYIVGPIERFERRKNAFMTALPDHPFGREFREQFKARTGHDNFITSLPYSELESDDHIGQSLGASAWRLCREYSPKTLPVTPSEARYEATSRSEMSRLIKKVGLLFGAEMVHITKVDPRWIYKGLEIPHEYAIIVAIHHEHSLIDTAPSHFSALSTAQVYSKLKFITSQLADFICGLGYDAAYRETLGLNPEMLMVPLAIDAGMGEFARNGRVLSPEFGINMRLKAVTTDLPLEVDKPISFGVHEFCMICEHCALYCPAKAIPFGPPTEEPPTIHNNPGFKKWYERADRCLTFWSVNKKKWLSCGGRCISVCPWSKPLSSFHNMVRWTAIHSPSIFKKMLIWSDKVFYRRKKSIKEL